MNDLAKLGWHYDFTFDTAALEGYTPARVISEMKGAYILLCEAGECRAQVSGQLRHLATQRVDYPVVGDWVLINNFSQDDAVIIHKVLPRKTIISRKVVGDKTQEQPLASNIDFAFIMMGLDHDFNLRRLERYLTLIWNSGATPIILLNKKDLITEEALEELLQAIELVALGVPVYCFSLVQDEDQLALNLNVLDKYLTPGKTVVLLGSSGVGKSTLTNYLLNDVRQKTNSTRVDDSKGRHTTTQRHLFLLNAYGALLIDTPGMRELQLWESGSAKGGNNDKSDENYFSDIESLAENCRFNDCRHENEPGCAVLQAIKNNVLPQERLKSFHKLQKELHYLAKRQQEKNWEARMEERSLGKFYKKTIQGKRDRFK